ncbi:MAG TPA: hypothetical protein VGI86_02835 [Acidimicrobiia bacterium]
MSQRKRSHRRSPTPTVAGESALEILSIAARFEFDTDDDGMCHFEYRAAVEEIAPLVRAVMRVEAELLVADAATFGTDHQEWRTPEQRGVDALIELVQRASAALTQAA